MHNEQKLCFWKCPLAFLIYVLGGKETATHVVKVMLRCDCIFYALSIELMSISERIRTHNSTIWNALIVLCKYYCECLYSTLTTQNKHKLIEKTTTDAQLTSISLLLRRKWLKLENLGISRRQVLLLWYIYVNMLQKVILPTADKSYMYKLYINCV